MTHPGMIGLGRAELPRSRITGGNRPRKRDGIVSKRYTPLEKHLTMQLHALPYHFLTLVMDSQQIFHRIYINNTL